MKKYSQNIIVIFFFVTSILSLVSCNEKRKYDGYLYPIRENGLYGYIDSVGNRIIEPEFLWVSTFHNGLAMAIVDTIYRDVPDSMAYEVGERNTIFNVYRLYAKYGYIDKKSHFVIEPNYLTYVDLPEKGFYVADFDGCYNAFSKHFFSNKRALFYDTTTWKNGFIDIDGKVIIKPKYYYAARFNEGLAVVRDAVAEPLYTNNACVTPSRLRCAYIDTLGNSITDFKYETLTRFCSGRGVGVYKSIVKDTIDDDDSFVIEAFREPRFLIDKHGEEIKELDWTYKYYEFSRDGVSVALNELLYRISGIKSFRFIDKDGCFIEPLKGLTEYQLDSLERCDDIMLALPENASIVDATYFGDGYAGISPDSIQWFIIDKYFIIHGYGEESIFEDFGGFSNGIAAVKRNGKWGYVDTKIKEIIPCKYDSCGGAYPGLEEIFEYDIQGNIAKVAYINRNDSLVWESKIPKHGEIANEYSAKLIKDWGKWTYNDYSCRDDYYLWLSSLGALLIIAIIVWSIYLVNISKRKKVRASINEELHRIEESIEEGKLITASKTIESIRTQKNIVLPEYETQLKNLEQTISNSINEITQDVHTILDIVKQDIIEGNDSKCTKDAINKILENNEIPSQPKTVLREGLTSIDKDYNSNGIIPEQSEVYTQYETSICDSQLYCYYVGPNLGTIVFPYRHHKVELRGFTEQNFENKLRDSFSQYKNYKILGDVSILPMDGCHPYEPDISIIEKNNKYGIRIDVEIDEPYSGWDKTPIHYIGCGDEFRDKVLANLGWIVIRFSEKQIFTETSQCINYIKYVLSLIDSNIESPSKHDFPTPDKKWTEVEARMMAVRKYREELLNHEFGKKDIEDNTPITLQTDFEKYAAECVKPILFPIQKPKNIDNSNIEFRQDKELSFDPNEHIYLYGGNIQLKAVSNVISEFFTPFDSIRMSERTSNRTGVEQCELLEDWDSKGLESREVGTFLHAQIEAWFCGKTIATITNFVYNGEYIHIDKKVSIQTELSYFKSFLEENKLTPFRTEWHICDVNLGIAGTIDLLAKNGSCYDIYDWKRSRKASPTETIWQFGINGLEHIPDISYYHYALQQNLYRYILENNYGISISNMYIVVFHAQFDRYYKYQIPKLDAEIQIILNYLNSMNSIDSLNKNE